MKRRFVTIVGARPQFVKAAVVSRAVRVHNAAKPRIRAVEILVHTGQHYDENMSDVFFRELGIPEPRYHLGVGSGPHGRQTGRMLERIEAVLLEEKPDFVLVYGDTNSTLAGALAAMKLRIPVAHVEAGLRSRNWEMPEETNRVLADRISSLLFCPTGTAAANLAAEGITRGVHIVGDVMYDAFLAHKRRAVGRSGILGRLGLRRRGYALATIHRQENTDDPGRLGRIFEALGTISRRFGPVIVPLHPRTRGALDRSGLRAGDPNGPRIVPPASYLDMIALESGARVILTDSGGVQKEAYFARVPCVTLRTETEWVETVAAGANQVAGTGIEAIAAAFDRSLEAAPKSWPRLYGRGDAGRRVLRILLSAAGTR
jgi:UDP-GlcNAc3NAcA epimerase